MSVRKFGVTKALLATCKTPNQTQGPRAVSLVITAILIFLQEFVWAHIDIYLHLSMAVASIEADEAVASSVFVQIMGTALKKLLVRVILIIFGHFASSDFKVWLR